MDRGAWWATVHGVAKSQTRLSNQHACMSNGGGGAWGLSLELPRGTGVGPSAWRSSQAIREEGHTGSRRTGRELEEEAQSAPLKPWQDRYWGDESVHGVQSAHNVLQRFRGGEVCLLVPSH